MTSLAKTLARPTIDPAGWQSVRPLNLDALARAKAETVNLAQWLARIEEENAGELTPEQGPPGMAFAVT